MVRRIRTLALALPVLVMASALAAQDGQGSFLAAAATNLSATGGLYLVNPVAGSVTSLNASGDLTYSYTVAANPYVDSQWFVGTTGRRSATRVPAIYRVTATGGNIVNATQLAVPLTAADANVYKVHVLGHELLFLTSTQLSLVPLAGGTPRVLLSWSNAPDTATDFACDGRTIYLHMQPTAQVLADHIQRIDLEAPALGATIYTAAGITTLITSVTCDDQGGLLVVDNEAFSGVATLRQLQSNGNQVRSFTLPFTYGSAGARIDVASRMIVVAGRRFDTTQQRILTGFITLLNWQVFKAEYGTGPQVITQVDVRRSQPLFRYGHACESAAKWRAAIAARGVPQIGNTTYALELEGLARAPAILIGGVHGAITAPIPLAVLGAGSCELGVLPLFTLPFALDASGKLAVPLPLPSTLAPGNVDIQWLAFDRAANAAGFVTSQVGSIVLR